MRTIGAWLGPSAREQPRLRGAALSRRAAAPRCSKCATSRLVW
mgnify:CR=1 FL=1